jgi:PAS domain S-box-containing protein
LRPTPTLPQKFTRSGDLVDAAIAANEAPTLVDAFQSLCESGLALLAAELVSVTLWDEALEHGTVIAGAGTAAPDVGVVRVSDTATRESLRTGAPFSSIPAGRELPEGTVIHLPLMADSCRATVCARWRSQLEPDELAEALGLFQTLARLTSIPERALREREQTRLDSVLEGVADGVIVSSGSSVTANAAARAILSVPDGVDFRSAMFRPRTLEGQPFEVPEGAAPGATAISMGRSGRFRIRATSLDERDVVLDGSVAPVDDGAVVVFRDVTAEHARAVLNEQYLYALFNSMPIPLTVGYAQSHEFISANQAFLDLVGYDREEVVGVTPPFPWWDPSEDLEDGFDPGSVVHRVYRRKDGQPLTVEVASHGIEGDDGETVLLLGIVTDLTEKRRLDQQLVQSGKLAAIGELAAGVAHEINNPLFAILGLTEFLLKESEAGSRSYQRLELIQQTGLEIKEIVRALLDFARENAEERHVVPLEDVIRSTVDLIRRTNAHKGVELVDAYDGTLALVNGSPNQLKQIFLNLIANARQAMPNGGTVRVDVRRDDDHVVATVADDGPGIAPHVLERVFEPFFTTKRLTGGTGLGLSVSLGIAESHGGTLTATSDVGRGSTFTLRLPLAKDA